MKGNPIGGMIGSIVASTISGVRESREKDNLQKLTIDGVTKKCKRTFSIPYSEIVKLEMGGNKLRISLMDPVMSDAGVLKANIDPQTCAFQYYLRLEGNVSWGSPGMGEVFSFLASTLKDRFVPKSFI